MMHFSNLYETFLLRQEYTGKKRVLPTHWKDSSVIDFSSNDYFCLSQNSDAIAAAHSAAQQYGVGGTGSRLLSGNNPLVTALEDQIAAAKNMEATLVFPSGYQANISVLSALCNRQVLGQQAILFFDRYNHASLYQAAFLSHATLVRYPHQDLTALEALLKQYQSDPRPKLIVSETLFGMDGDVVDLQKLTCLAQTFDCLLYLDEAHATGLLGDQGYGLSTTLTQAPSTPWVVMGTFSKALGCQGGYVACSQAIKNYLINACPGFIYSTAPSPMVLGAAQYNWKLLPTLQRERKQLFENALNLRAFFNAQGFSTGNSTTPILPIILKDVEATMAAQQHLLQRGIRVSAIRPPTVSPDQARLRISLNTSHTDAAIEQLKHALKEL